MTDELRAMVVSGLRHAAATARSAEDADEFRTLVDLLTDPPPAVVPSIFEGSDSAKATVAEATERAYKRANKNTTED